ncbi:MerR family transcriptional regulator [Salipaludibacillus daqingensis]|uniref:MerR family transcriptional regulator n=1 Tax=Salipaludibacillus daqingensis TaxID=3041001 RepID=UPI002476D059|nr:MerR family transcriptional regulator [Salipaludibacillus daqingensis]
MSNKMRRTKEIADEFGVNPSTIQRWIKHFQLPCEITKNGHFELNDETYEKLKHVHEETKKGKKMRSILLPGHRFSPERKQYNKMVSSQKLDEKINRMLIQVDQLDRNLQTKADEVVEYQVLNQRKEINELNDLIHQLSQRLKVLEKELPENKKSQLTSDKKHVPIKKRRLAGIFSL